MATGAQIQAKIKSVLDRLQATPRVVRFREVTQTGGNDLLGIGGTVTVTLSAIDPQPAAELVRAEEITGSNSLLQPGDWRFIFSGDTSEDDLRTKQLLFGDEILNIVHVEPYALGTVIVGWGVIARTVQARS
jgi:hypothetical protein